MRKAKLTIDKHLLPSFRTPTNEHNAQIIFDLHDELTDAVMAFYKCARRNVFQRKELIDKIIYCTEKIGLDLNEVIYISDRGKPIRVENTIRTSGLDRLLKVIRDADLIINANPR